MKILNIEKALKRLPSVSDEIHYKSWVETGVFTAGLISFHPQKKSDPKQIIHQDRDVLCHVLRGRGRLRAGDRRTPLKPGIVCHIPRGTPHDFAAARGTRLVLFCSVIKTG